MENLFIDFITGLSEEIKKIKSDVHNQNRYRKSQKIS